MPSNHGNELYLFVYAVLFNDIKRLTNILSKVLEENITLF